jgi:hypothetical protein
MLHLFEEAARIQVPHVLIQSQRVRSALEARFHPKFR